MTHSSFWTPERVERLTELHREGKSASQIAKALGGAISRSAVLGKFSRIGLKRPAEAARQAAIVNRAASQRKGLTQAQWPDVRARRGTALGPVTRYCKAHGKVAINRTVKFASAKADLAGTRLGVAA